ncbi:MAG: diiron oxygenase [Acidimicrobiia bacterium]|nr:diiron oxygenase [Acidimicrobiia bacterium]MBV9041126.1 diiron oxygenase [Acidimicrobiia bacterium]
MSTVLDTEQATDVRTGSAYESLIDRLSQQSVVKHFDAYADVPWDHPEYRIDPADPRWELSDDDPLGATDWYKAQPQEVRARIGLQGIVSAMKTGLQFESVLKRGLLEYATTLPNGASEFRYAYHEVIEEAHHSLMFQEFVNRSEFDPPGMPKLMQFGSRGVVKLGRKFPELFFLFVLGGEDPIDYVQRQELRGEKEIHPLLERIMRIHVTEEARHLSFARHYLKRHVPELSFFKKRMLAVRVPFILGSMAGMMLRPSKATIRKYRIPKSVIKEAFDKNPEARQFVRDSIRKVRNLCVELGIITPISKQLWKAFGIWDEPGRPAVAAEG